MGFSDNAATIIGEYSGCATVGEITKRYFTVRGVEYTDKMLELLSPYILNYMKNNPDTFRYNADDDMWELFGESETKHTLMPGNLDQWYEHLLNLCANTEYNAGKIVCESKDGVYIYPRINEYKKSKQQRIAIYPKKEVDPGIAIEDDVYRIPCVCAFLGQYDRYKSQRPHYNRLNPGKIDIMCRIFLGKL